MRVRQVLAILAGVMFYSSVLAQGLERPATLADTANLLRSRLVESGQYDEVSVTPDFAVIGRKGGKDDQIFYPDNLHLLLRRLEDPQERQNALDTHLAALAEAAGEETDLTFATLDRVIPVVRHRDYGDPAPGSPLVNEPLAGDLAVFYVLDGASTVQYISEGDLIESKLTLGQVKAAAEENLSRLGADVRIEGGAVGLIFLDGYYESSLLLDKRLWHRIARDIPNLIAIAPARDLVAFGDGSDPRVSEFLHAKAVEISKSVGGVLTDHVLRWTEVGWITE